MNENFKFCFKIFTYCLLAMRMFQMNREMPSKYLLMIPALNIPFPQEQLSLLKLIIRWKINRNIHSTKEILLNYFLFMLKKYILLCNYVIFNYV